jgi:hypothetical protein
MIFTTLSPAHPDRFIRQYVVLRNHNKRALHTEAVSVEGTRRWLSGHNGTIIVGFEGFCTEKKKIHGAAVLKKNGEVTVFHDGKVRGLGRELLGLLDTVRGHARPITPYLWAWTDKTNKKSRALFKRMGYKEAVYFRKDLK